MMPAAARVRSLRMQWQAQIMEWECMQSQVHDGTEHASTSTAIHVKCDEYCQIIVGSSFYLQVAQYEQALAASLCAQAVTTWSAQHTQAGWWSQMCQMRKVLRSQEKEMLKLRKC